MSKITEAEIINGFKEVKKIRNSELPKTSLKDALSKLNYNYE